jgi:hypothetical protein
MTHVATMNQYSDSPGVRIVYLDPVFRYDGGDVVPLETVLWMDSTRRLDWVSEDTRTWAYGLRAPAIAPTGAPPLAFGLSRNQLLLAIVAASIAIFSICCGLTTLLLL